jgi:hypothetical protein
MKAQSPVLALAMALGILSAACAQSGGQSGSGGSGQSGGSNGSGGSGQSGGSNGSGGSSSTGGTSGSCTSVSACGGNVVGTWNVSSACLDLSSSNLDISLAGLDPTSCKNVTMTGSLHVSGTWTANSDLSYKDGTTTTGSADIELPAGCLMLSGTTVTCDGISGPLSSLGFSSITCVNAASGGGCSCTGTVQQSGLPGVTSLNAMTSGNYASSGNTLTIDGSTPYSYCVSGSNMTWTPQTTSPTTKGTIVFQKSGATGTGGAMGTGGATGTGGAVSSGGTTGTGGAAGSGATGTGGAKGGATGSGGAAGSGATGTGGAKGGTTGTGGAAGSGTTGTGGTTSTGGSSGTRTQGPCDIYAASSPATLCAAAYSTIRGLSMTYTGALYQVRSGSSSMNTGSGGTTKDIGMTADGFADTATQDTFCSGSTCTFSILYDQSGNGNHLKVAPAGTSSGGTYSASPDFESSATHSLTVGGHKVYSLYMNAREGYRLTAVGKGMPTGAKAQGIYELADGTHTGTACCWDFGDVSTDPKVYSTMNTIFFGTGFWGKGAGSGPWFMGDFEGGVWSDGASTPDTNSNDPSMKVSFAFGIVKTAPPSAMSIRVANGNLPSVTSLTTAFSGNNAAKTWNNSGGILLGIGSDNSNNSWGTFYEGAITNGEPSDATDALVMANLQAAGYGK